MKVTVAMPAFNAEKFIDEAIDSVLAQDFTSFELAILDDGSTDRTWRRMRRYLGHPRVRLHRNRRNRGAGAARNTLMRLARGRYLTPCDADDLLMPGALRRLSGYLDRHPRVGVVYGDILEVLADRRGRMAGSPKLCGKDPRREWDVIDNVVNHAGSMIRKALAVRVGGYDESVYSVDDWSLWLKLSEVTRFKYLAGEITYVWRRHPASLTHTDPRWQADVDRIRREALARRFGVSR